VSAPVEVAALIDRQQIGRFHIALLALCAVVLVLDGFDTQAIGYVAPVIVKSFALGDRAALTAVFRDGLLGGVAGAVGFGLLADRFGRKPILILCALCFGVFSLATMTATSLDGLRLMRFLTGLGLGGGLPNAVALISEYSTRRLRATMVTATVCGFAVGGAAGGFLAAWLLPRYGWTAIFLVGGVLPLAFLPVMIWALPDSLRHVVARRPAAEVARLLARMDPRNSLPPDARFVLAEATAARLPVRQLFGDGRAVATAMIWIAYFTNLVCLYFLTNWLPTLINGTGIPVEQAAIATAMLQVGGIAGAITLGFTIDRFGYYVVLASVFMLAAVFITLLGAIAPVFLLIALVVFGAGFCIIGGQIGLNALAAATYPSIIRSTGIGSALGVGRLGSVAGPWIGGVLLARHLDLSALFLIAAVPALGAATAILVMRWSRHPAGAALIPSTKDAPS
jgi:MFS transporter, AAHS family, 4-hydroxybenzoate transporter